MTLHKLLEMLDRCYYSRELGEWISLREMLDAVDVEDLPNNEQDLNCLLFCFGITDNF